MIVTMDQRWEAGCEGSPVVDCHLSNNG